MKFNAYNDCYDSSFSDELLTKCKKATVNAVKKPTDDADDDQELELLLLFVTIFSLK